ncbi:MAG: ABC transporter permease [Gemmatimonadota bacterium]|nr:ABC transporter permease [Gemmatimonadota bacterium]
MRNKTFSAINISGLAIGMACCMLILLYVQDELSYDRHHENADRIFRLATEIQSDGAPGRFALTSSPMGSILVQEFPSVEDAVRFHRKDEKTLVANQQRHFYERGVLFVDANVFQVFDFPLSKGDPQTALQEPNSIVLTDAMALKYFGDEDPMGRTLSLGGNTYKITGVLKDSRYRSHLRFDFLASLDISKGWLSIDFYTYLLLQATQVADEFDTMLPDFMERHLGAEMEAAGIRLKLFLQPLTDIHLHSHLDFEISPNGDIRYIYLFLVIAFIVLVLACINFMNLSTARSEYRSMEIGLRKVVGANRGELTAQFLGESTLLASIAIVIAGVMVEILLPSFEAFVERDLVVGFLKSRDVLLALIGIALFTGLFSGSYPAFFLSSLKPVLVFRGVMDAGSKRSGLRKTLIIVQFAISVILVIGTGLIYDQADYVRNRRLGFRKEHIVVMPNRGSEPVRRYRNMVSAHSAVLNVTASSTVPGGVMPGNVFFPLTDGAYKDGVLMNVMYVDHGFVETLGIEVLEGRALSDEVASDRKGAFMLNQAAMRNLGWTSCANRQVGMDVYGEGAERKAGLQGDVVGVVKDFHYKSLHHEIEPLVIMMGGGWTRDYISIRIRPDDVPGTLDFLRTQWREVVPNTPFEYSFLDTSFDRLYRTEARLGMLFGGFSVLAIVVAALGLFGLASISVQQRTKEIGIRKAVGASVANVVLLLSREYVVLVGIANLVAWPIAYFAMNRWLENFAYRVDPAISTFVLGGLLSLSIALITVSYETGKAARANPVDALRYE